MWAETARVWNLSVTNTHSLIQLYILVQICAVIISDDNGESC